MTKDKLLQKLREIEDGHWIPFNGPTKQECIDAARDFLERYPDNLPSNITPYDDENVAITYYNGSKMLEIEILDKDTVSCLYFDKMSDKCDIEDFSIFDNERMVNTFNWLVNAEVRKN